MKLKDDIKPTHMNSTYISCAIYPSQKITSEEDVF